jgi:hypothetical protein
MCVYVYVYDSVREYMCISVCVYAMWSHTPTGTGHRTQVITLYTLCTAFIPFHHLFVSSIYHIVVYILCLIILNPLSLW